MPSGAYLCRYALARSVFMSGALPASAEGKGAPAQEQIDVIIESLTKSLRLLDAAAAPPELGARVQDGLDAVVRYRDAIAGKA